MWPVSHANDGRMALKPYTRETTKQTIAEPRRFAWENKPPRVSFSQAPSIPFAGLSFANETSCFLTADRRGQRWRDSGHQRRLTLNRRRLALNRRRLADDGPQLRDVWPLRAPEVVFFFTDLRTALPLSQSNTAAALPRAPARWRRYASAIFVKAFPSEEGTGSSDKVFDGNNVVLNGIALWDLTEIGTGQSSDTEIGCSDCQGCASFIGTKINFQNVRFTRCAPDVGGGIVCACACVPDRAVLKNPIFFLVKDSP